MKGKETFTPLQTINNNEVHCRKSQFLMKYCINYKNCLVLSGKSNPVLKNRNI